MNDLKNKLIYNPLVSMKTFVLFSVDIQYVLLYITIIS
jgi:hypothetical protein